MKVWELRKALDNVSDDAEVVITIWCAECEAACKHDKIVDAESAFDRLDPDGLYFVLEPVPVDTD